MNTRLAVAIVALMPLAACYHATVETGLAPAPMTIQKPWAHGFVYGIVSPSTVETQAKCPNGVAKVETQQSFLNGVVSLFTAGLYTPWTITVTCGAA